jgi:hypothetical protein
LREKFFRYSRSSAQKIHSAPLVCFCRGVRSAGAAIHIRVKALRHIRKLPSVTRQVGVRKRAFHAWSLLLEKRTFLVFENRSLGLTAQEKNDLVEYLKSLPERE